MNMNDDRYAEQNRGYDPSQGHSMISGLILTRSLSCIIRRPRAPPLRLVPLLRTLPRRRLLSSPLGTVHDVNEVDELIRMTANYLLVLGAGLQRLVGDTVSIAHERTSGRERCSRPRRTP